MIQPFVPEGILPMRVGVVARVLGFPESTIRHWTRTGRLACSQAAQGRNRYVTADALAHFANLLGITPRWEEAFSEKE